MNFLREKADLLRLLGHPTRLAIIQRLAHGPKCVTDIQELLDVPQANVSQHLMALRSRQIVDCCEHGNLRCYYIARPNLAKLLMKFLAEDCPVVEQYAAEIKRLGRDGDSRLRARHEHLTGVRHEQVRASDSEPSALRRHRRDMECVAPRGATTERSG